MRLLGTRSLAVGTSVCSPRCFLPEQLPAFLGPGVASSELASLLVSCKSSDNMFVLNDVGAFRFVRGDLWIGSVWGWLFFLLTSLASRGAMCRIGSIVVVSC